MSAGYQVSGTVRSLEGSAVANAGVVTALSSDQRLVKSVTVWPKSTNTDDVRVGMSNNPIGHTPYEFPPIEGQFYRLDQIFFYPVVSGEGVDWIAHY